MLNSFVVFVKGAWKAVVAAATPIVLDIFNQLTDVAEVQLPILVTAVTTALVVYFVPNKPPAV